MNPFTLRQLNFWIATALLIGLMCVPADAQRFQRRPGGGPGGGGFNRAGGGLFGTLLRDEAQQELGLTEEQLDKARELADAARPSREDIEPFSERFRAAAGNEAETAKIQTELAEMRVKKSAAAEQQLQALIGEQKVARLRQLTLQFEGSRALSDENLQNDLGLTDAQKTQLEELRDRQREARRDLGFRASEAERQQFDREWNQKLFGVLTDEQRQKWQQKAGEIIVSNGVPGAAAAPAPSTVTLQPGGPSGGNNTNEQPDTGPPSIADPLPPRRQSG